jgi:CRP-like cAMP-binding protein
MVMHPNPEPETNNILEERATAASSVLTEQDACRKYRPYMPACMEENRMGNPTDTRAARYGRDLAFGVMKNTNACWRSVLHLGRQFKLVKGKEVQQGKDLLFLESGKVYLKFQNLEGVEKILWYAQEGCIFGAPPFFDPIPNEGVLISATDCVIYAFSTRAIDQISKERPDLLLDLLKSMSRWIRILTYHASSMSLDDTLVRICRCLSQRLVPGSSPLTAKIGISRQEMANLLGIHRISLYRVLREQQERGLFGAIRGKSITILRPHEFYELAKH